MKHFLTTIFAATLAVAFAAPAYAAQASASDVRCPRNLIYSQTTGICVAKDSTTNPPTFYYNGEPAQLSNIKTVGESFDYGDGLGIICESTFRQGDEGFTVASSANQACDTTCGSNACVIGLNTDGSANGAAFIACDGGTADSCLCAITGLDLRAVGCGADWEAPALGVDLITTDRGFKMAHVALFAQDIGPDMDAAADGLDIAGDQTEDEGVEILTGMYGASGAPMVPGVDPAFQLCVTFELDDVSGTDEFWLGFRSVEAPNATFNNYNTYAVLGFDNKTGDWHTETEDDGAGFDTDDVAFNGLADDTQVTACVRVDDNRYVSYTVGNASITAQIFQFDDGEPVIPFLHMLHSDDLGDEVFIQEWEVSYWGDD